MRRESSAWSMLDEQLVPYGPLIRDDLGIQHPDSERIATRICEEILAMSAEDRQRLAVDDPIPLAARVDELKAFQMWMDIAAGSGKHPAVVRAQVIVQNYVCFVYLGDALFKALRKDLPKDSVCRKCAKFLTDNPVRAFRNAVAHANWRYLPDFSGIEFWARKGGSPSEPLVSFRVTQERLDFWQKLARIVAYVAWTVMQ